jgi:hypothetical protein
LEETGEGRLEEDTMADTTVDIMEDGEATAVVDGEAVDLEVVTVEAVEAVAVAVMVEEVEVAVKH